MRSLRFKGELTPTSMTPFSAEQAVLSVFRAADYPSRAWNDRASRKNEVSAAMLTGETRNPKVEIGMNKARISTVLKFPIS
jgi:hypothetical protein